ncbi:MAG TPA: hypothetical protein VGB03_06500 [Acidimicrobiales bacterium]
MARRIRIRPVWNKQPSAEKLAQAVIALAEQLDHAEVERSPETPEQEQAS